jgi:hypothetical protein
MGVGSGKWEVVRVDNDECETLSELEKEGDKEK